MPTNCAVWDQVAGVDGRVSAPVEDEIPLGDVPATVNLGERVKVSKRGDHDHAVAVFREEVVGDRVALAGRLVAVDRDRALPVEVHHRLVAIQIGEHRGKCLSSFEHVGRLTALAVHVHREAGVGGEERLLPFGVAVSRTRVVQALRSPLK